MTEQKKYVTPGPQTGQLAGDPAPAADLKPSDPLAEAQAKADEKVSEETLSVTASADLTPVAAAKFHINEAINLLNSQPKDSGQVLALGKLKGALEKLQG